VGEISVERCGGLANKSLDELGLVPVGSTKGGIEDFFDSSGDFFWSPPEASPMYTKTCKNIL
jgi:hypothetical protein